MEPTHLAIGIGAVVVLVGFIGFCLRSRRSSSGVPSESAAEEGTESDREGNWLVGTAGEVEGQVYHVGQRIATIGRDIGSFIQLQEAGASRRHLQLSPDPEGLLAVDMKSKNGTFVDDQRITSMVVQDGSLIRIGNAEFKYCRDAVFDVEDDVGLGTKQFGAQAQMVTMTAQGSDPKQAARDAVAAANGDLAKAASQLGVSQELLDRFLKDG